jgi:hypothetical protein
MGFVRDSGYVDVLVPLTRASNTRGPHRPDHDNGRGAPAGGLP